MFQLNTNRTRKRRIVAKSTTFKNRPKQKQKTAIHAGDFKFTPVSHKFFV